MGAARSLDNRSATLWNFQMQLYGILGCNFRYFYYALNRYGIGIGAGSMLYNAGEDWENGIASDIHHALCNMATAIKEKRSGQNIYVAPKFPRFLYKIAANVSLIYGLGLI